MQFSVSLKANDRTHVSHPVLIVRGDGYPAEYRAVAMLKNENLAWDGKTETINGRTVEKPANWVVGIERIEERVPYVLHDERDNKGIKIDASNCKADVTFKQTLPLKAGTYYAVVDCESHVQWQGDPHTVRWNVEVTHGNSNLISDDVWINTQKGSKTFAVRIQMLADGDVTVGFRYRVKWANTEGEMRVNRLILTKDMPHGVAVKSTIIVQAPVTQPPTLPDEPVDLWQYLLPSQGHVHLLSSNELVFVEQLPNGTHLVRKNHHQEQLWTQTIDGREYIMRGFDDSADYKSQKAAYIPCRDGHHNQGGKYGQDWLPRYMKPGDKHSTITHVTYYQRHTGNVIERVLHHNHYTFVGILPDYRGLNDVAVIEWRLGDANKTTPDEVYAVKRGYGYVGWGVNMPRNTYQRMSSMVEVASWGVKDRYMYTWFNPAAVPAPVKPPPPVTPPPPVEPTNPMLDAWIRWVRADIESKQRLLETLESLKN